MGGAPTKKKHGSFKGRTELTAILSGLLLTIRISLLQSAKTFSLLTSTKCCLICGCKGFFHLLL